MMEQLLTIAEGAALLKVSPKHLRRWLVNAGLLRVVSLGKSGKGDRIAPSDLQELINSQRRSVCSTSEAPSGGSNLRQVAKLSNDPLGLPAKGRPRKSSAR